MKNIQTQEWGKIGADVIYLYTLTNANGLQVNIANFGAAVQAILVPDSDGGLTDVVLGYDDLKGYLTDEFYIGTVVGRYANRIAGGTVNIDGNNYRLTTKNGAFHHHGGKEGFNKKVWRSEPFQTAAMQGVKLTYVSVDGEEGFPGELTTIVTYTLNNLDQLIVDYDAITDQPTIVNLTQHTYFNLAGHNAGSILGQQLILPPGIFLPVNELQVPYGETREVEGTPFNFREAKTIGRDINMDDQQLELSCGYDHSWVIKNKREENLVLAAKMADPESGRTLNVYTTEPAVHVYTGNFLDVKKGKDNAVYGFREGVCLETQNHPDSPNHPDFPSSVLMPGERYKSQTIFEFGWNNSDKEVIF